MCVKIYQSAYHISYSIGGKHGHSDYNVLLRTHTHRTQNSRQKNAPSKVVYLLIPEICQMELIKLRRLR